MEKYITSIRTIHGDLKIDYNSLANLPEVAADSYSKTETLSASTKTKLGLSSNATPDDAFKALNDAVSSKADSVKPEDIGAAPLYGYGTEDLIAGTSTLASGVLYFVYE